MTKLRYVVDRGYGYEFRITVPKDLRDRYDQTAIWEPLKTKNELEAQKRADALAKEYKAEFKEHRTPSEPAPPPKVQPDYHVLQFGDEGSLKQNSEAYELFTADRINRLVPLFEYMRTGTVKVIDEYAETRVEELKSCLHTDADGLSANTLEKIRIDYLEDGTSLLVVCNRIAGSENPPNVVFLRMVARSVIPILISGYTQIRIETMKAMNQTPSKHIDEDDLDSVEQDHKRPASDQSQKDVHLFSEVLQKCIDNGERQENAEKQLISGANLFIQWSEDKPISEYTEDDLVDFKNNCLRKLPTNWSKKYEGKSLREIIKLGSANRSRTTVNNIMSKVRRVFSYAVERTWINVNPAVRVREPRPKESKKIDRSYSDGEIKKLFENLKYEDKKPSRYWMVLIALHNSFRANEICQLHTSDIFYEDGIPCFDINENDKAVTKKSVKNHASCRIVPIHPALIKAGFMKYVKHRKKEVGATNALLFPDVTFSETAHYTKSTGRWFNRTLKPRFKDADNNTERGVHSLRHTFGRYAKNRAKMNKDAEKALMGHGAGKAEEVHDAYTVEEIQFLYDELQKLDYGLVIPANPFMK